MVDERLRAPVLVGTDFDLDEEEVPRLSLFRFTRCVDGFSEGFVVSSASFEFAD